MADKRWPGLQKEGNEEPKWNEKGDETEESSWIEKGDETEESRWIEKGDETEESRWIEKCDETEESKTSRRNTTGNMATVEQHGATQENCFR